MKIHHLLLIFLLVSYSVNIFGRQTELPVLDTTALQTWPSLIDRSGVISNDGKYAGFSISKSSFTIYQPDKLIFKSLKNSWKVEFDNIMGPGFITEDSKLGLVLLKGNLLCIQELGKDRKEIIPDVNKFKLVVFNKQQYLVYYKLGENKELVIRNLSTQTERKIQNIVKYEFSENGGQCYMVCAADTTFSLERLSISSFGKEHIWKGTNIPSRMIFDNDGLQLCFQVDSVMYYWSAGMRERVEKISPTMDGDCKGLTLKEPVNFSASGQLLFVKMESRKLRALDPEVNPVQVFSYQDGSFDINGDRSQSAYLGVYNINSKKLARLEHENERFRSLSSNEDIVIVSKSEGENTEYYWNRKGRYKDFVFSLNGSKIASIDKGPGDIILSPTGNYLLYQKSYRGDIYCLNIKTGQTINLTEHLPIPLKDDVFEEPQSQNSRGLEFYKWSNNNNESVILYDRYDIWKIDLSGNIPPLNLTNNYGRRNHIVFRFCPIKGEEKEVVLSAFNEDTKDNGFYRLKIMGGKDPILLTMGRFVYVAPGQSVVWAPPIKAKDRNIWLVWRMSTREAPNYYWTSDFKTFKEVSHIHPERSYRWHTTELIEFKTKDGITTQAVLYKPDNFDPTKKYPVLFNYYEQESARLNAFLTPKLTDSYYFNYPMMLAQDYLICLTDIHFKIGETAHSIVDAVEGAADYMSRLSYVDSTRYGVCGGSFGGYATNCLTVFSRKFAAAISISGVSDLVSGYGNVPGLRDEIFENRQLRMGVSLSTDPERYLSNSPVAYTKRATTPVLIVNTTLDNNVNVQQGIEFFISLRREGRFSWMLRYQHRGHGIGNLSDQYDLYTRINQFYGHYLKKAPAPIWMTRGLPSSEIGVKSGSEYDKEFSTPLPSSLLF